MSNRFSRNTQKITTIYNLFSEGSLIVDTTYQRRKVWGVADNIRLIETILLDMIIPEIFVWDYDTDPDTGKTITHIVDGQQRINAIFDYIAGKYKLQKKYLLDDSVREQFGDKYFADLDPQAKKDIWSYELSMVNLDKSFDIDDVRTMFYRLNLTDYSLNDQEKRNSWDSEFGKCAEIIADEEFWRAYKVFSSADIRRMRDIEYCSSILLLVRDGIVDQTKGERLDQVYKDFADEYPKAEEDTGKVKAAMDIIRELTEGETNGFVNKKIQMYTLFTIALEFYENTTVITEQMKIVFKKFVALYVSFKNEYDIQGLSAEEEKVFDNLKKYKLASSEGVNKLTNRVIRYEIMKKILLDADDKCIEVYDAVFSKIEEAVQ